MAQLSISLLGDLQVVQGDTPLPSFHYTKVRALLALLAVEPERSYRREELIGLLWPDMPETAARTNLRQALSILRGCLGDARADPPVLRVSRDYIQWNTQADVNIDMHRFTNLLKICDCQGQRLPKDCRPCAERRTEALQLFRGDLLRGFFLPDSEAFDEWLVVRRENLHHQAVEAFHNLAEFHERRGEYDLAEELVRRDLELEPWDEASHRQLMRLLYLSERRSQALAQYELCRKILYDELGVEPEEATTALYEQIRSEAIASPVSRTSLALPAAHPHNLPPTVTPFFGREQELARIADTFENGRSRIISLVGSGGVGKTRLALQAATQQLDNFRDGVFLIPLEDLQKSEDAAYAIARTLELKIGGEGDPILQLVAQIAGKELLLVLDNYEHLLPDLSLPLKITGGAPRVSILVTSRRRLNLIGEQVIDVNGLSLAKSDGSGERSEPAALALFAACAARARAGFELQPQNRVYAEQICRMLDGIPLAIELAATWLSVLTCQELVEELHRDVNILSGTLQGVPERQNSLRVIFDYAWELLTEEEAQLFRRLAVFHGGFSRQAAEEVAGANLLLLKSLADKLLIRRNFRQGYEMHELANKYACERLAEAGETDELRWRHLDYYIERMEASIGTLYSHEGPALANLLEDDHNNLRAALNWALDRRDLVACLRLYVASTHFWFLHNHYIEADRHFEAILAAVQASRETFPPTLLVRAYYRAGVNSIYVYNYERTQRYLEEAVRLARLAGDQVEQAAALHTLGEFSFQRGDVPKARQLLEEALAIRRAIGKREGLAGPLIMLGTITQRQHEFTASRAYIDEGIALAHEMGNLALECRGQFVLAWQHLLQNDLAAARRIFLHVLAFEQQLQHVLGIAGCLEGVALVDMASAGKEENGARIYGAAEALLRSAGLRLEGPDLVEYAPFLVQGRHALGDEAWEKAVEAGSQMAKEDAIRLAEEG